MALGAGLGKLSRRVFRIGHMGSFNELMLAGTLSGVEMGLRLAGVPHQGRRRDGRAELADSGGPEAGAGHRGMMPRRSERAAREHEWSRSDACLLKPVRRRRTPRGFLLDRRSFWF